MNITAADRSALIRLARTLPVGSEGRKAILAGLKTAGWKDPINLPSLDSLKLRSLGEGTHPKVLERRVQDIGAYLAKGMSPKRAVRQWFKDNGDRLPEDYPKSPRGTDMQLKSLAESLYRQLMGIATGLDKAAAQARFKGKKASASLKDVLRKWPEFAPEIQKELRGLRAALRGDPDFGRVSNALIQIQMRLEDDHRRDPAAFHARAPFNKALADFAKAEYEHKTGNKW